MSQSTETICLSLFILLFAFSVHSDENLGKLNKTGEQLKHYQTKDMTPNMICTNYIVQQFLLFCRNKQHNMKLMLFHHYFSQWWLVMLHKNPPLVYPRLINIRKFNKPVQQCPKVWEHYRKWSFFFIYSNKK